MELNEVFSAIERNISQTNQDLGFRRSAQDDTSVTFSSADKGKYRLVYERGSNVLTFECTNDTENPDAEFNTISRNLLELNRIDDRELRSLSNEVCDEVERLFHNEKKINIDKVKMPKAVSKGKAKSGVISYDVNSLANRFGTLYPEFKNDIKQNIADYGEFLPETFFKEKGTPKVLDVIRNGSAADQKKLFKALGEIFEDGTNEVQDIIGVSILGEMKNDPEMMAVADKYMSEYMAGPVHEINKITAKKNSYTKKLENPPAYKPKKKKAFNPTNALSEAQKR